MRYLITKYDNTTPEAKEVEVLRVDEYQLFEWLENNNGEAYTVHKLECILDCS